MIKYLFISAFIAAAVLIKSKSIDQSNIEALSTVDSLGQEIAKLDFGAELYSGTHENIDELLDVIKDKYKGKAVILDLWGTFCPPCLSDFKNSPARKAELRELDVHMVYLCAGKSSNYNEWRKIIERDKLIGDHIYLDHRLTNAYMDKFNIKRYPNYILIDKAGLFKQGIISAVGDINVERFKAHI